MNRPIVINTTGTHGIGKSTLIKKVAKELENKGFKVVTADYEGHMSPERRSKSKGFLINQQVNFDSEYHILASNIMFDLETRLRAKNEKADFVLADRNVVDIYPYSQYSSSLGGISHTDLTLIQNIIRSHLIRFPPDILIAPCVLPTIEEDGVRPVDKNYQSIIDYLFKTVYTPRIENWFATIFAESGFYPVLMWLDTTDLNERVEKSVEIAIKYRENDVNDVEVKQSTPTVNQKPINESMPYIR